MIKVLMIAKALEVNGVSKVMFTYYRNLDKSKFKIDFVSGELYEASFKNEIEGNGDNLHVIANRDSNPYKYLMNLSELIKKEKYDIVHVHGNSAMIFLELMAAYIGRAKIRIAHSHNTTSNHNNIQNYFRPIFNKFYTHGIACSREAGQWMFGTRRFVVVNNGIDVEEFTFSEYKRNKIRKELNINDELVMGHVGMFNHQKNQEFLIEILRELLKSRRDVKLLLVGEGSNKAKLIDKINELGIEKYVIFYGITDKVADVMMAMDIFVFPSRFEGLGIVLIEAQATGLPCLVSNIVPSEANICNKFNCLSLSQSSTDWIKPIISLVSECREFESNKNIEMIVEKKYDIYGSIKSLESFYLSCLDLDSVSNR